MVNVGINIPVAWSICECFSGSNSSLGGFMVSIFPNAIAHPWFHGVSLMIF